MYGHVPAESQAPSAERPQPGENACTRIDWSVCWRVADGYYAFEVNTNNNLPGRRRPGKVDRPNFLVASVGRTYIPDWPTSAIWQRAALFEVRLSSSDSTLSQ